MADSTPDDHRSSAGFSVYSDTDESLASLHTCLSKFADSHEFSMSSAEVEMKIGYISDWVEKEKKDSDEKAKKELVQSMGKVATSTVSGLQKMGNGDVLGGILEIISGYLVFTGETVGGPIGATIGAITGTICSIIGAIFGARRPQQPSMVEQVAEVVHKELVELNSKMQDQKYDGLKRRVSDQTTQLERMKPGDKRGDPYLWNDYVQFMGELGNRIQSPLPYKYDDNLTKDDPDVADFIRALMTYCQAYGCFNALLIKTKGTFADLGSEYREYDEEASRKISGQLKDLKDKLAFLFGGKYLTFLGRLPSEGGKLTKIVAFSRNPEARLIVKMTTRGFGFPELLDYKTIETQAEIVSRQSVKLKLEAHPKFNEYDYCWLQFINETPYPLKVIGGTAPKGVKGQFTQVLLPRSSVLTQPSGTTFNFGGYVIIYIDGRLRDGDEPSSADVTRVIEFALYSGSFGRAGVNIQDKTGSEFTRGQDTYDKMKPEETKVIYWKTEQGEHFMVRAVLYTITIPAAMPAFVYKWRFVFQDFDPSRDIITAPKKGRVHINI